MLPLVVHQNKRHRGARDLSFTRINGGEELGCSRWSFTRIREGGGVTDVDNFVHQNSIMARRSFSASPDFEASGAAARRCPAACERSLSTCRRARCSSCTCAASCSADMWCRTSSGDTATESQRRAATESLLRAEGRCPRCPRRRSGCRASLLS